MESKELRIGNWLSFNNHIQPERFVQVDAWFLRQLVNDINDKNPTLNNYYSPIPITPEILEKTGFERKFTMGSTKTHWAKDDFLYAEDELVMTKGLHWLQNFHYFRTGSELPINL